MAILGHPNMGLRATVKDIPEIAEALAGFIADPQPYTIFSNPPLELRIIAAEVKLLPVILDMGGCYGLRPSGEVVSFPWDEPQLFQVEMDTRIRNLVYYQANLKYPRLASLVPCRPVDAVVCPHCGGSGQCPVLPGRNLMCYCGGLSNQNRNVPSSPK